jgi:hypothetical protein
MSSSIASLLELLLVAFLRFGGDVSRGLWRTILIWVGTEPLRRFLFSLSCVGEGRFLPLLDFALAVFGGSED